MVVVWVAGRDGDMRQGRSVGRWVEERCAVAAHSSTADKT